MKMKDVYERIVPFISPVLGWILVIVVAVFGYYVIAYLNTLNTLNALYYK